MLIRFATVLAAALLVAACNRTGDGDGDGEQQRRCRAQAQG